MKPKTDHVLVLGGTSEARDVAQFLIRHTNLKVTISLAGVLGSDAKKVLRQRVDLMAGDRLDFRLGGFGGAEGLSNYLKSNEVAALIDSTHPFASRISQNACDAAERCGIPIVRYTRPSWSPVEGDTWTRVSSLDDAASCLRAGSMNMLAVGRMSFEPFRHRTDCRFVLRSIGAVERSELPDNVRHIKAMPGRSADEEVLLMNSYGIECLVTKNSGASQSYFKVVAARQLGMPVIMVDRPALLSCQEIFNPFSLDGWLHEKDLKS